MCGIGGLLSTQSLDAETILARMKESLRHRGPDGDGQKLLSVDGRYTVGLCHTRLAILDLSPAGLQPMTDPATGSSIVFNGEIYNHRELRRQLSGQCFRSSSDTETLLQGWLALGADLLPMLRGMFAFALYDAVRQEFWLVRDRLGIKPLYVSQIAPATWLFASELRTLLASGLVKRTLNPRALESYLAFGAVPAPWSIIDGIQSLLPGEYLRFRLATPASELAPERVRYWRPPFGSAQSKPVNRDEAVAAVRACWLDTVQQHMLADVPVGVFLSGGIDSSSIVAALAHQGHQLHTFSIVFGESTYDESAHARQVAQQFGMHHAELYLSPASVLDSMSEAIAAYDQPSIDGINSYFIARAVRDAGLKVALSGVGGDELFAGYPYFRVMCRLEQGWHRPLLQTYSALQQWIAPRSTRATKLRAVLRERRGRLYQYAVCRRVIATEHYPGLLAAQREPNGLPLPPDVAADIEAETGRLDPVNAQSLMELSLYMANMLLRDTDQMSMAHALEVRVPFLDHVFVETVARLPGQLKLRPDHKGLLLDALPARLSRQITHRPKMGFVFPWEKWLRQELRPFVEPILSSADLLGRAGLCPKAVQAIWRDFRDYRPNVRYTDILCLVNLLHWIDRNAIQ